MTAPPLSARLRDATRELHGVAERAGGMPAMLGGRVERASYCLLLRNYHALYAALEDALDRHRAAPQVAPVRMPALYRAGPLRADLDRLHGADWPALPLAPAMRAYVARVAHLAQAEPALLAAHAYVRYMGDLSGGQILRDIVRRAFALPEGEGEGEGVAFYAFDGDGRAIKAAFRAALDALPVDEAQAHALVAEARDSFARHVALFEELEAAAPLRA